MINKLSISRKVVITGDVSKNHLRYLYSSCYYIIYPSIAESIGYILVEAMSCGTAIICSNTTAMPEVCGDAALYFDPHDTDDILKKMIKINSSNKIIEKLRTNALLRSTKFSTQVQGAEKLIKMMEKLQTN